MPENDMQPNPATSCGTTDGGIPDRNIEPCACCRALATKYVAFVPAGSIPSGVTYFHEPPHNHAMPTNGHHAPPKSNATVFRFPSWTDVLRAGHSNGGKAARSSGGGTSGNGGKFDGIAKDSGKEVDLAVAAASELEDESLLKTPKNRRLWHGVGGLAVMTFGVALPLFMMFATAMSCPKRITLVILNHPLETLAELLLLLSIPFVNRAAWASLCRHDTRFPLIRGIALGAATGTSLLVAGVCIAALFCGTEQLSSEIGTSFNVGFSWFSILSLLAACASVYMINQFRLSRDFTGSRRRIVAYSAIGAILSLAAFTTAEARPWLIRVYERMAVSNSPKERLDGLSKLRALDPERELRMECSDSRAAGLSGLFMPLKERAQQELYFTVTGKPYSFHDANADFDSMPDEAVGRNAVGDKVDGLSLVRSSMTGEVHPQTLVSSLHWTFVFKNDGSEGSEARAEIGLPSSAVVTGLKRWVNGEGQDASFVGSGKVAGVQAQEVGHDSPAMITDLGRGRVLLHCYPVPAGNQLKVEVTMVVPLNPDGKDEAAILMPKFLATNFSLEGEHDLSMKSDLQLSCADTKGSKTADKDRFLLNVKLKNSQLDTNPVIVEAALPDSLPAIAMLDKTAVQMKQQEEARKLAERRRKLKEEAAADTSQVTMMIDGSKGLQAQLDDLTSAMEKRRQRGSKLKLKIVKPEYVVQTIKKTSSPAPKHLVVVIDGSNAMSKHVEELTSALKSIPSGITVSVILASQDQPQLMKPATRESALKNLRPSQFAGGQNNLAAVVAGAQLAGESRDGAVLWIHGPQPAENSNIYIVKQYVAAPRFYDLAFDSGDVDMFEFFKNHSEVGPFEPVPSNGSLTTALTEFFAKWQPGSSGYSVAFSEAQAKPAGIQVLSDNEWKELLQLHAYQEVLSLIKSRHSRRAATIAVRYGVLSPVSTAVLGSSASQEQSEAKEGAVGDEFASGGTAPSLQGATNGTIGPQGADVTYVTGVNTAGTVRVNNLANLEALLNIIANLSEMGGMIFGLVIIAHGLLIREDACLFSLPIQMSCGVRVVLGLAVLLAALAIPGTLNWFVASARDANLFS